MAKSLQVKNENDLPPHVTFEQFQKVYNNLSGLDQVLWGLLWETGGRITAVLSLRCIDIDLNVRELKLLVQKKKKITTIRIPLSNAMISDLKNYMAYLKPDNQAFLFSSTKSKVGRMTRQGAFKKIREWGKVNLGMKIHPHMMRHGLAVYLLSQGVPLPAISRRLGHSNVFITQKSYLVITPELDRQLTAHVPMR